VETKKAGNKLAESKCSVESRKQGLTVVSLFAGAGGLDIAVCRTGQVGKLFSTDSNTIFLQTVSINIPAHFPNVCHTHLVADAHDLSGAVIREALGTEKVDLVVGGPPCDDFTSTGKKKGAEGKKAPLIFQFARLIGEIRPRMFLFENVPNLRKMCGPFLDKFQEQLSNFGYSLKVAVLDSSEFGVPSIRKRLFIAGFLEGELANRFEFPRAIHGEKPGQQHLFGGLPTLRPLVTVEQVLRDLPDAVDPEAGRYLNHSARTHRPETVEHMKSVPQGVAVSKSYRYRAPWKGQCRSLTAGLDDSAKAYIHPIYHREMTVREYARIHGFPDTWEFAGKLDNGLKQVANAVPINLGVAVLGKIVPVFIKAKLL